MSCRPRDRRLLTLLLVAAPGWVTPSLAGAAPELVWGTYYEGQIHEFAAGAPAGLAPLADGVVVRHNAFIAAEDAAATALVRFGGAAGEARPHAAAELDGGLYLAVATRSPGLATAGGAAAPAGERDDVVLARFDGGGELVWSIYFGGEDDEVVTGLAVDSAGRIYLGGQTSSPTGIATAGAHQSELMGAPSMFLAMFREEP